ncbi:ciliary neurotrophic factor [Tachyglossus aculeatus]|uniref:ciliary neurotrophic factor n=1 Tax=Tachyglossus aculeatus TaxID=9261 RepID=UPI0018F66180|nr:ciliary neurotrophic factor [Tachyglossus aculeatus]
MPTGSVGGTPRAQPPGRPGPAELPMALAGPGPGAPHRRSLCTRSIWLARKIRSDLTALLDSYVEHQGLSGHLNLDSVAGVPPASTDRWSEMTEAERLQENLRAYRAFHALLGQVLEVQRALLTPTEVDFHEAIHAVLVQVAAFIFQLEELMGFLEHAIPPHESPGAPGGAQLGAFEKKLLGLKVLRELEQWTLRSVRDLRLISSPSHDGVPVHAGQRLAEVQKM